MSGATTRCTTMFRKVTHVIFDMDGLLLDTETSYTQAAQNVLSKFGKTYLPELKIRALGLRGCDAAQLIAQELDLPIPWQEYYEMVKEQYPLVLNTETIYTKAFAEIGKRFGKVYTPAIKAKAIGRLELESARVAVHEMQLPITPEQFAREYVASTSKHWPSVGLMPGAERLVKHLHFYQIPIAIATSSGRTSFDLKIKKHGPLFKLFSHVVTAGSDPMITKGKPNPDIFLVCAKRFKDNPKPEKCLVFEDAPNGVEAAVSAGMQVVMVPDPLIDKEQCKLATVTLNSLQEMKPEIFGLPPFP